MKLRDLVKFYGYNEYVIDIILEDDMEYYLKDNFNIQKQQFTQLQWEELMFTCSQKLRRSLNNYERMQELIKHEVLAFLKLTRDSRLSTVLQPSSINRIIKKVGSSL